MRTAPRNPRRKISFALPISLMYPSIISLEERNIEPIKSCGALQKATRRIFVFIVADEAQPKRTRRAASSLSESPTEYKKSAASFFPCKREKSRCMILLPSPPKRAVCFPAMIAR